MSHPPAFEDRNSPRQHLVMFHDLFERLLERPTYARLDQDSHVAERIEKEINPDSSSKWVLYCYVIFSAISITVAGAAGYLLGTLQSHSQCEPRHLTGTVTQGTMRTQNL